MLWKHIESLKLINNYYIPEVINKKKIIFRFNLDSVGKPVDGVETMLANKDAKGEGEICIRGRHVFMGYLNEPTKTKETFDDEGWLKTGDIGKIDDQGYLYITGRIKVIFIIICINIVVFERFVILEWIDLLFMNESSSYWIEHNDQN